MKKIVLFVALMIISSTTFAQQTAVINPNDPVWYPNLLLTMLDKNPAMWTYNSGLGITTAYVVVVRENESDFNFKFIFGRSGVAINGTKMTIGIDPNSENSDPFSAETKGNWTKIYATINNEPSVKFNKQNFVLVTVNLLEDNSMAFYNVFGQSCRVGVAGGKDMVALYQTIIGVEGKKTFTGNWNDINDLKKWIKDSLKH